MKSTGIVRRIDDLGRIAVPKEVRRALHIKAGDPLEVYTDKNGSIIFRKYIDDQFAQWAEYLTRYFGDVLIIYNIDGVKMFGANEDDWRDPMTLSKIKLFFQSSAASVKLLPIAIPLTCHLPRKRFCAL